MSLLALAPPLRSRSAVARGHTGAASIRITVLSESMVTAQVCGHLVLTTVATASCLALVFGVAAGGSGTSLKQLPRTVAYYRVLRRTDAYYRVRRHTATHYRVVPHNTAYYRVLPCTTARWPAQLGKWPAQLGKWPALGAPAARHAPSRGVPWRRTDESGTWPNGCGPG
eukprot:767676-Alexandrium_andersonii.AAC.1